MCAARRPVRVVDGFTPFVYLCLSRLELGRELGKRFRAQLADAAARVARVPNAAMPLVALPPPGRLLARRPWTAGNLARGLPMALAVWLAAIPLLGAGPTWAKACYARVARATQRGKAFEYTQLEGAHEQLLIGTVPRSAAHLQALHDEGVRAVVTLNQAWEPQAPCLTLTLTLTLTPTPALALALALTLTLALTGGEEGREGGVAAGEAARARGLVDGPG